MEPHIAGILLKGEGRVLRHVADVSLCAGKRRKPDASRAPFALGLGDHASRLQEFTGIGEVTFDPGGGG